LSVFASVLSVFRGGLEKVPQGRRRGMRIKNEKFKMEGRAAGPQQPLRCKGRALVPHAGRAVWAVVSPKCWGAVSGKSVACWRAGEKWFQRRGNRG
jgi:hypothetical protein